MKFVIGRALTILSWDNPVTAFFEKVKNCATALAGHRAAILFNLNLEGIVMTETMGVAIGMGLFALVFIFLGCLVWKKE